MARRSSSDPRVQAVVEGLVELYLRSGSVNAMADAMVEAAPSLPRIHPNRLHSLLSGDPSRGVNDKTLDAVETALKGLRSFSLDGEGAEAEATRGLILTRARTADR